MGLNKRLFTGEAPITHGTEFENDAVPTTVGSFTTQAFLYIRALDIGNAGKTVITGSFSGERFTVSTLATTGSLTGHTSTVNTSTAYRGGTMTTNGLQYRLFRNTGSWFGKSVTTPFTNVGLSDITLSIPQDYQAFASSDGFHITKWDNASQTIKVYKMAVANDFTSSLTTLGSYGYSNNSIIYNSTSNTTGHYMVRFHRNGTYMTGEDYNNGRAALYSCSTPYNLSSTSFVRYFDVPATSCYVVVCPSMKAIAYGTTPYNSTLGVAPLT